MRRAWVVLVLVPALALAGCMDGSGDGGSSDAESSEPGWTFQDEGEDTVDESAQLPVPSGEADVWLGAAGQASVHLVVLDAEDSIVVRLSCNGASGCWQSRTGVTGEPGDWSIELKGAYDGGVSASVRPM